MPFRLHVLQTLNSGGARMSSRPFSFKAINLNPLFTPLRSTRQRSVSGLTSPQYQQRRQQHIRSGNTKQEHVVTGQNSSASSSPFSVDGRKAHRMTRKANRTIIEQVEPAAAGSNPSASTTWFSKLNPVVEKLRLIRQRYEQRRRFDHWDSRRRRHHQYQRTLNHALHRQKHTRSTRQPGPRDPHDPWKNFNPWWNMHRFNPWWSLQKAYLVEYKRAIARSFIVGGVITGLSIFVYTGKYNQVAQLKVFFRDFAIVRELIVYTNTYQQNRGAGTSTDSRKETPAGTSNIADGAEKRTKIMTPEQVELRLAENQRSVTLDSSDQFQPHTSRRRQRGGASSSLVHGFSANQLASNNPSEDDLSQHVVRDHDGVIEGIFFGVFDGHGGWCCSHKVAQELAPTVAQELQHVRVTSDSDAVMKAIEDGFKTLDHKLVHDAVQRVLEQPSRSLACSSLLPAVSGSCALLAYVNLLEKDLYVACTGDSRAVLGVREPDGKGGHDWCAVPMSVDQTGRSPLEVKRLQEEHPGEEATVIRRGRVLGGLGIIPYVFPTVSVPCNIIDQIVSRCPVQLEPTRAFGDGRYKWTRDIQEKVFALFPVYRQPRKHNISPPYVTAKPVVVHHRIKANDRFLVMATDGLWDKLTSDEVVQLVGELLDGKTGQEELVLDRDDIRAKQALNSVRPLYEAKSGGIEKRQENEEEVAGRPTNHIRKFTFRDHAHASTHLIRNALGGAEDDKVAATLSIPSPMSRRHRDDITVTVVFFGTQENSMTLSDATSSQCIAEIHSW
ncbi:hypothetical protein BG004_006883 [Podila humilis]|nr:hypothetical protein BG004_006883 [Podila humilis]